MKTVKTALSFLFLFVGVLFSANTYTSPVNFGGGLNVKTSPMDIDDTESPDMSNLINDSYGASFKRGGSDRYIDQAISSNPINTLFKAYVTSNTDTRNILAATTKNSVYYSTSNINPKWLLMTENQTGRNQSYSMLLNNGKIIMAGDKQTDNMGQFDVNNASFTTFLNVDRTTVTINIRPKYIINSLNYFIAGNVKQVDTLASGTTDYPNRINYSILLNPSSMTAIRYIDISPSDGDEITGLGELNKVVNIFKKNSIYELNFTVLNPVGYFPEGDQILTKVVDGFGMIAPKSLANTGIFYIFLAKDGIRMWDGGNRNRLDVLQESRIISGKVSPIIDKIIESGTYPSAVGKYYAKKGWYVFSFEDPEKFPRGQNNSVLIYDIDNGSWFPFNGWNASSFETFDGKYDKGELVYGGSDDGYVFYADFPIYSDDARKEIVIDTMDETGKWLRAKSDTVNVKEGTASLKMVSSSVIVSSVTRMGIINMGEWNDKASVQKTDKILFKINASTPQNISSLRLDFEMNDVSNEFDAFFTSVTISSSAFVLDGSSWATLEVKLSSFPIPDDWVKLSSETLVFANTLTIYGLRFILSGIGDCSVSIDDLRVVGGGNSPLNAYRYTKQFNLGNPADKNWRQLILTREASADSSYSIDVLNNFGQVSGSYDLNGAFEKAIYVGDYDGSNGITKLSSIDFSVLDSTLVANRSVMAIRPLVVDENYIYAGDQYNNRLLKIAKSTLAVTSFEASYGSFGIASSSFNIIYQMAIDDTNLYVCDFGNHRVKVHKKDNFDFVNSFGSLGQGNTNFHLPSGIAVDEKWLYVADDGNYRLVKIDKLTGDYKTKTQLNMNTIGDTTVAVDDRYLYVEYNTVSNSGLVYLDVALEKRNKSDLSLINKVILKPKDNETYISTYTRLGDISLSDQYIYVSFTDDINRNGSYYIQKRLKSDFSIVSEKKLSGLSFTTACNGLSYKPKLKSIFQDTPLEGAYIQLKYYENNKLDNNLKLYNQAFIYEQQPIQEKH